MRLDHLLSKETSADEIRSAVTSWSAGEQEVGSLFNLEGTSHRDVDFGDGGLAQLGERLPCKQEVIGSIPIISTIKRARSSAG